MKVTESQARVLRAIAYYEVDSNIKGATQYLCYNKVPQEFHVSGSTFNDNIKYLERKLMVTRLESSDNKR
ncbi:MarR family transcriptional regulator, partial [Patescibacteria group bacterium]|nr:MarR family transcriptional regulator [Patescibacteria group bacterium]